MVHPEVRRAADRYLAHVDQLLPGLVTAFYLVGSTALGAYRHGRSDIDFVAVVDRGLGPSDVRRLRIQHVRSGLHTGAAALRERRSPLAGTCNGIFVRAGDLAAPVSDIVPVASHTGISFNTGPVGSDVSPVAWKVLAERGIAVRGPAPSSLPLDPEPHLLRSWNRGNLDSYWQRWATAIERSPSARFGWFGWRRRWSTAWGVLGAPRLHRTIATGEVVSKEVAGEHALEAFPSRWHPLIAEALAYWRGQPDRLGLSPGRRGRLTAEFVFEVIDAHGLDPVTG